MSSNNVITIACNEVVGRGYKENKSVEACPKLELHAGGELFGELERYTASSWTSPILPSSSFTRVDDEDAVSPLHAMPAAIAQFHLESTAPIGGQ